MKPAVDRRSFFRTLGLGAAGAMKRLTLIGEVTQPGRRNVYKRPDGSLTHWE